MAKIEKRTDEFATLYAGNGCIEIHVKCENVTDDIIRHTKSQFDIFCESLKEKTESEETP